MVSWSFECLVRVEAMLFHARGRLSPALVQRLERVRPYLEERDRREEGRG